MSGAVVSPERRIPIELCRGLFAAVAERPDEVRVDHIWTPECDLLLVKLPARDRSRLTKEDVVAIFTVVERITRQLGREVVVDLR